MLEKTPDEVISFSYICSEFLKDALYFFFFLVWGLTLQIFLLVE